MLRLSLSSLVIIALLLYVFGAFAQLRAPSTAERIKQAQEAISIENFAEAVPLLDGISDEDSLAEQAQLLRGYALYKLTKFDLAQKELKKIQRHHFHPQATFLLGMIAISQAQWTEALALFLAVQKSAIEPWASAAQPHIELLHKKIDEKNAERRQVKFEAALNKAKEQLSANDIAGAQVSLDLAEKLHPQYFLTSYYRGYLAYLKQDYRGAEQNFRRAIEQKPDDHWSGYMLALAMEKNGQQEKARLILAKISADQADQKLRWTVQQALFSMQPPTVSSSSTRKYGGGIFLTAGGGADTNPAIVSESASAEQNTAGSAFAALQLYFQRTFTPRHQLNIGATTSARDYFYHRQPAAQTDAGTWASYNYLASRLALRLSYGYNYYLYDYEPFLSSHLAEINSQITLKAPWFLETSFSLNKRNAHHDNYQYLEALGGNASFALWFYRGRLSAQAGYQTNRDWAEATQFLYQDDGPAAYSATYVIDYSLWGHGPFASVTCQLPWKFLGRVAANWQWRLFDNPETYVTTNSPGGGPSTIWWGERHDSRLAAELELSRPLVAGISAAWQIQTVDNFSSLGQKAIVDRNYRRRMMNLLLRWSWPGE